MSRSAARRCPALASIGTILLAGTTFLAGCGEAGSGTAVPQVTVTATVPSPSEQSDAEPAAATDDQPGLSDVQELEPSEATQAARVSADGAVGGLGFRDSNGENTVVLREVTDATGASLFVDHVAYPQEDTFEVLREVRDGVQDCDVDVTAAFVAGSLAVHDDNQDGVGEVTFTYRVACRGDVSAAEQKLIVLEDGEKFILRGWTSTPFQPFEDPVPEPEANNWPDAVYARAIARFRELAPEFTQASPSP